MRRSCLLWIIALAASGAVGTAEAHPDHAPRDDLRGWALVDPAFPRARSWIDLSVGGRAWPAGARHRASGFAYPCRHWDLGPHPGVPYGPYALGRCTAHPVWDAWPYRPPASAPLDMGPVTPAGRVEVSVRPQDAEVWVDGRLARAGEEGGVRGIGVLAGLHDVEVRAAGHETVHEQVQVEGGRTAKLSVRLEPRSRR